MLLASVMYYSLCNLNYLFMLPVPARYLQQIFPTYLRTMYLISKTWTFSGLKDVESETNRLPIAMDTLNSRNKSKKLSERLEQLEDGIRIFSQPKVYVVNEEDQ